MKYAKYLFMLTPFLLVLMVGCKTPDAETTATSTEEESTADLTGEETADSIEEDTSAATEQETETVVTEDSEVKLYYEETAQVELISPGNTRILIDVYNPAGLSSPAVENDVLLTTHSHQDHYKASFLNSFPGQQLQFEPGDINLSDVTIKSIVSSHNATTELDGSNYIFIIDI